MSDTYDFQKLKMIFQEAGMPLKTAYALANAVSMGNGSLARLALDRHIERLYEDRNKERKQTEATKQKELAEMAEMSAQMEKALADPSKPSSSAPLLSQDEILASWERSKEKERRTQGVYELDERELRRVNLAMGLPEDEGL